MNKLRTIAIAAFLLSGMAACSQPSAQENVRLSWDGATYQTLSSIELSDGSICQNLYYPRAKRLSDGSILLSFMDDHYGWNSYVARSTDGGKTWTDAQCIRHMYAEESTVGADMKVFVNPDFIELRDGRIMLAHQWRYKAGYNDLPNTNENCGIEIMFSSDKGLTWTEAREVYRGRCWEPAMLELPSGEIQMYITDSQNVVRKMSCPKTVVIRSFDGGQTWQGKERCSYKDVEGISYTKDERFGYDGMPSGVLLDDGSIAVPLEVWSGKYVVDVTPVVVKTTAAENWNLDQEKLLAQGGPDYPAKKQVNKDFVGYGPYSCRLESGEMLILSNGNFKGESGVWVFVGDKTADNFHYATRPFDGYWGCIDYLGGDNVIASGSYRYNQDGATRGELHMMKGRVNRSIKIAKGGLGQMAAPADFDRNAAGWWFLGKKYPSSVYASFGYTSDAFEIGAYVFDSVLTAYTVENSDAAVMQFARKGKTYKAAVNARGEYTLYELERWSWHLIGKGVTEDVQVEGNVNNDRDIDLGYCAKLSLPWKLIGGKPSKGEQIRAHMCRMYKANSKEKPGASFEELEGENSDYPCEWLSVTLK